VTDIPFRVYGPQPLNGGLGEVMYTAPAGTSKFFIRDVTFSNIGTSATRVKASIGSITDPSKRIIDQDITANTTTSIRPLWLLDAGETLQGLQIIDDVPVGSAALGTVASGTDGTSFVVSTWAVTANTMYLLVVANGAASGTTALNPSSITGQGTWTLINQTTSTVAAAVNQGVAVYYFWATATVGTATTTVNFASTQHSCIAQVFSVTNLFSGITAIPPWTSSATPIVQSGVDADTTAPASTAASKTVTLPSAVQTGYVFYYTSAARAGNTVLPPTNFTEIAEREITDASGSVASMSTELSVAVPPATSATVGPATFSAAGTSARASVAWEMVPSGWVNCTVSGVEVH
jgi:hypothetical protein